MEATRKPVKNGRRCGRRSKPASAEVTATLASSVGLVGCALRSELAWVLSAGREVVQGAGPDVGSYEAAGALFADGFESGDTSAWTCCP